jgi:hypothetical protein
VISRAPRIHLQVVIFARDALPLRLFAPAKNRS